MYKCIMHRSDVGDICYNLCVLLYVNTYVCVCMGVSCTDPWFTSVTICVLYYVWIHMCMCVVCVRVLHTDPMLPAAAIYVWSYVLIHMCMCVECMGASCTDPMLTTICYHQCILLHVHTFVFVSRSISVLHGVCVTWLHSCVIHWYYYSQTQIY